MPMHFADSDLQETHISPPAQFVPLHANMLGIRTRCIPKARSIERLLPNRQTNTQLQSLGRQRLRSRSRRMHMEICIRQKGKTMLIKFY